jgi:hypothetical protein
MSRRLVPVLVLLLIAQAYAGAQRREFLSDAEVEEMRETADDPPRRLRSMVKFAQTRILTIDQIRSDPRFAKGRGTRIHDLLEQFVGIVDELDTNIDSYAAHDVDLRKPLKDVIEAGSDFQLKLRTLKDAASGDPRAANEAQEYNFILEDAIEAVAGNLANARSLLEQQNAKRGEDKEKRDEKKDDKKSGKSKSKD